MRTGAPPPHRCPYCGSPVTVNGSHIPAPPPFPLDAEQLVRLVGAVLTQVLNGARHPDAKILSESDVTLGLGEASGVRLPTGGDRYCPRLLPYGSSAETVTSFGTPDRAPRREYGRPPSASPDQQDRDAADV